MTREERIRYLKGLLKCELCEEESTKICKSCDNRRIGSSAKCYDALADAIKALEQASILDKIRAEMFEEMQSHSGTGEEVIQAYADGVKKGLDILDKYKAEFEAKDKVSQG